jgi:thiosulfate dehydrogenase (quinone) large subunit
MEHLMTPSRTQAQHIRFEDPGFIRSLFGSPELAWVWLVVRVYLGYQWLTAGWEKVQSAGWMSGGQSLAAYWQRDVAAPVGGTKGIVHYGWYHDLLALMLQEHWYSWFAKVIAVGEVAVGVLLIVGAFVGIAGFLGMFMNFNYMLAGSASTNPVLFAMALLLILAWKTAGYYGLDYVLLPAVGVPWQHRGLFGRVRAQTRHGDGRPPAGTQAPV